MIDENRINLERASKCLQAASNILGIEFYARVHFKDSKGGDPAEWPENLRVREMPQAAISAET